MKYEFTSLKDLDVEEIKERVAQEFENKFPSPKKISQKDLDKFYLDTFKSITSMDDRSCLDIYGMVEKHLDSIVEALPATRRKGMVDVNKCHYIQNSNDKIEVNPKFEKVVAKFSHEKTSDVLGYLRDEIGKNKNPSMNQINSAVIQGMAIKQSIGKRGPFRKFIDFVTGRNKKEADIIADVGENTGIRANQKEKNRSRDNYKYLLSDLKLEKVDILEKDYSQRVEDIEARKKTKRNFMIVDTKPKEFILGSQDYTFNKKNNKENDGKIKNVYAINNMISGYHEYENVLTKKEKEIYKNQILANFKDMGLTEEDFKACLNLNPKNVIFSKDVIKYLGSRLEIKDLYFDERNTVPIDNVFFSDYAMEQTRERNMYSSPIMDMEQAKENDVENIHK